MRAIEMPRAGVYAPTLAGRPIPITNSQLHMFLRLGADTLRAGYRTAVSVVSLALITGRSEGLYGMSAGHTSESSNTYTPGHCARPRRKGAREMNIDNWIRRNVSRFWRSRGVNIAGRKSVHRKATHADRYSPVYRAKRKARRKMARMSRRRNR